MLSHYICIYLGVRNQASGVSEEMNNEPNELRIMMVKATFNSKLKTKPPRADKKTAFEANRIDLLLLSIDTSQ